MMLDMLNRLTELAKETRSEEGGFTTAELLGNAALGIVALAFIWGLLRIVGQDVITLIRTNLGI